MTEASLNDILERQTRDLLLRFADDLSREFAGAYPPPWSEERVKLLVDEFRVQANNSIRKYGLSLNAEILNEAANYFARRLFTISEKAVAGQQAGGAA
jgi:hypothetical protein